MIPLLLAWVEEPNRTLTSWIFRHDASSFAQGAVNTGKRQVVENCQATSGHRYDMIHMKCGGLAELRDAAVLAAILRARDDTTAETARYSHVATRASP
jgi:hypothetical protein